MMSVHPLPLLPLVIRILVLQFHIRMCSLHFDICDDFDKHRFKAIWFPLFFFLFSLALLAGSLAFTLFKSYFHMSPN